MIFAASFRPPARSPRKLRVRVLCALFITHRVLVPPHCNSTREEFSSPRWKRVIKARDFLYRPLRFAWIISSQQGASSVNPVAKLLCGVTPRSSGARRQGAFSRILQAQVYAIELWLEKSKVCVQAMAVEWITSVINFLMLTPVKIGKWIVYENMLQSTLLTFSLRDKHAAAWKKWPRARNHYEDWRQKHANWRGIVKILVSGILVFWSTSLLFQNKFHFFCCMLTSVGCKLILKNVVEYSQFLVLTFVEAMFMFEFCSFMAWQSRHVTP